jgi:spoIIIJ-associated protein
MSEHDSDTKTQTTEEPTTEEPTTEEPTTEEPTTEEPTVEEPVEPKVGRLEALETEGEIAADYLEELLDIADLDGDLDMDVEGDRAAVSIVGADLSQLVGRNGEVLDALQELTRLAVYRETGERSRLMLDISGHRAEQRRRLVELAAEKIAQVKETGEQLSLTPMTSFERKVVHDVVTAAGLVSESEGVEPRRFVVIHPA